MTEVNSTTNSPLTDQKPVVNNNFQSEETGQFKVNKNGFIEVVGEVIESLPSITFRVKLDNGQEVIAKLSGKMRLNKIMLIPGDRVKVEITPYDLTKGRIMYRL